MTTPSWLPALLAIDWNKYGETVDAAYKLFMEDFADAKTRPAFRGRRLGLKHHPSFQEKSATFWHMVTEGRVEEDRIPVTERLERIAWPKALIVNVDVEARVMCWCAIKKKEPRWHLALPDFSYLVVLADRGEYLLPWTAFFVDGDHQRAKLERECEAWVAAQKKLGPPGRTTP